MSEVQCFVQVCFFSLVLNAQQGGLSAVTLIQIQKCILQQFNLDLVYVRVLNEFLSIGRSMLID